MKVDVKDLPHSQAEITVEIPVDEYQPFLKQAAQKISENINIKGYRKGKADFEIIKKHVGEAEIWEKALDPAVQKTFVKVLQEKDYVTVGSPKVDIVKLTPDNPVIYKATISFLPKVELADYSNLKIDATKAEVDDKEVEKSLENLRRMHAKETPAQREAKMGDKVEIDFDTFLDKIPVDNGRQEKFELILGEGNFIPGFEEKIVGMKKDEEKKFQLKFPKDYHQKNLAGKMVDFKVKVKAVYNLELPSLTDEFAQGLGGFKSAAELRTRIKDNLMTEKLQRTGRETEEKIIAKVIEKSKFGDVPEVLVESEAKKMLDELEHNLSHQGMNFADYLSHLKKTRDEMLLEFMPQALQRVKSALIVREVAKQKNIEVTETDLEAEIQKTATMYAGNEEAQAQLREASYRSYLRNILTSKKVIEHLKEAMVK